MIKLCLSIANMSFSLVLSLTQLNSIHLLKRNLLTFLEKIKKTQFSSGTLSLKFKRLWNTSFRKWQHCVIWLVIKKNSALTTKTLKKKGKGSFRKFAETINFHWSKVCCKDFTNNEYKVFKNKWVKVTLSHSSENLQSNNRLQSALCKINPP